MAKKPEAKKEAETAARLEAERERERKGFVETMAGYGMPLEEMGLLMVPPLSKAEIETRYARELEIGPAKSKANLVQWIWASANKGNATMQIYLSKVMLGWNERGAADRPKEASQPNETPTPPQPMPQASEFNKIFNFQDRSSRKS